MPIYMYQFSYTAESWAAQLKKPLNRLETVGKPACEALGGTMLGGWYCFGEYDVVLIAEMPDAESMAGLALAIGAGGALKSSKTTALMTGEQGVAGMKRSAALAKIYKPAR